MTFFQKIPLNSFHLIVSYFFDFPRVSSEKRAEKNYLWLVWRNVLSCLHCRINKWKVKIFLAVLVVRNHFYLCTVPGIYHIQTHTKHRTNRCHVHSETHQARRQTPTHTHTHTRDNRFNSLTANHVVTVSMFDISIWADDVRCSDAF